LAPNEQWRQAIPLSFVSTVRTSPTMPFLSMYIDHITNIPIPSEQDGTTIYRGPANRTIALVSRSSQYSKPKAFTPDVIIALPYGLWGNPVALHTI
jgi:hypothetical protein